jgi:hypothetical protein
MRGFEDCASGDCYADIFLTRLTGLTGLTGFVDEII